jgi:hypothetical protein
MPTSTDMQAWARKLQDILKRAASARLSDDLAKIVAIQKELAKFIEDSPDFADALDTQARQAIFDLDLSVAEEAVANIKKRAEEVGKLAKLIQGVSDEAKADAEVLSGKLAVDAIDAATSAINSFKKLRDELSTTKADEKAIAADIDKVMASIQGLRNKLESH